MKKRFAVVLWVAVLAFVASPLRPQRRPGRPAGLDFDQAVTCSVHDAWELGGKTETGFFAIVKALAELSAQKRGLILPDKESTGREFGEYIKAQARTDRDQLLYEIVDRAVRKMERQPQRTRASRA